MLYRAVEQLCERGATPQSLTVAIGPALAPCCFELDQQRLADIERLPGIPCRCAITSSSLVIRSHCAPGRCHQASIWFDLPQLAKQMLVNTGIPAAQIDLIPLCTYCATESGSSCRFNTHHGSGYRSRYSWIRRR
ncbi:laccase domain-containing protein [Pantoea ananatis]